MHMVKADYQINAIREFMKRLRITTSTVLRFSLSAVKWGKAIRAKPARTRSIMAVRRDGGGQKIAGTAELKWAVETENSDSFLHFQFSLCDIYTVNASCFPKGIWLWSWSIYFPTRDARHFSSPLPDLSCWVRSARALSDPIKMPVRHHQFVQVKASTLPESSSVQQMCLSRYWFHASMKEI